MRIRMTLAVLFVVLLLSNCAAVQEIVALRKVNFSIDRVSSPMLAGIDLSRVQSYQDFGLMDVGRLMKAVASNTMPLDFQLHLRAENPADNTVQARMIGMEWTLFLQEKETISGKIDQNIVLPPGEPQDLPITISLDLVSFFEGNARDLAELALALAGQGGAPKNISLKAIPTIDTPLGPISYPEPLTIVSRQIGG